MKKPLTKACAFLAMLILTSAIAHCSTSSKKQNSLGVLNYEDNKNTYLMGEVVDGAEVSYGRHEGIVLRFQPSYTPLLYTKDVLFCGDVSSKFDGLNPNAVFVVTYETEAHESINGVGCHILKHVDLIKEQEIK